VTVAVEPPIPADPVAPKPEAEPPKPDVDDCEPLPPVPVALFETAVWDGPVLAVPSPTAAVGPTSEQIASPQTRPAQQASERTQVSPSSWQVDLDPQAASTTTNTGRQGRKPR
jgi:hypothetical protein